MEALSVDQIRVGKHLQYEPKWDGFWKGTHICA
jgi:hypothetical protein